MRAPAHFLCAPRASASRWTLVARVPVLAALALALTAPGVATAATAPVEPARATRGTVEQPRALRATRATASAVTLRWARTARASRWIVLRNGRRAASSSRPRVTVRRLSPGTPYSFQVVAVSAGGKRSPASAPAPATTPAGGACTLFASPDGSDAATGTADRPVRTVGRLVRLAGAGDVACLRGAFREDVTIRTGGTSASPLVLRSAPGTRAQLTGRLWIADSADHVIVQGLDLDGRNMTGDDLPSPTISGDHVRLLRNDITNRNSAICVILGSLHGYGQARDVVVDSNRIHHCGILPAHNHHHGIYVENAVGTRITNNVIFANADRGIQLFPNAQSSTVAHNVVDGNGQGLIFSGADGHASSGNRVVDNVFSNAVVRYNIEHWWPEGNPVGRRNVAARNCLWNGRDGNLSEPTEGYVATSNVVADPRYRNRVAGDFRPAAASACSHLLSPLLPLTPFRN